MTEKECSLSLAWQPGSGPRDAAGLCPKEQRMELLEFTMAKLSSLNVELLANFFTLLFHFHQEAFYFLFTFCHKGGVICISEVIYIKPI